MKKAINLIIGLFAVTILAAGMFVYFVQPFQPQSNSRCVMAFFIAGALLGFVYVLFSQDQAEEPVVNGMKVIRLNDEVVLIDYTDQKYITLSHNSKKSN
jgi:hypothetical protein